MSFDIPEGLTDLLQDFTVAVLRERPPDLIDFATQYFNTLNGSRNVTTSYTKYSSSTRKGVTFNHDEPMQTESSDEEIEPPPKNRFNRRKSISAEPYDPTAHQDCEKVVYPKTDEQRRRLNEAVSHILLFRSLEAEEMQEVIDAMFEKKVQPNEHVIDQGDDGDNFYVIDSGTYDIHVDIDGQMKMVGSYDNQGSFGELALMYNMPRAATIIATAEGSLWAMDRNTFQRIVYTNAFKKREMYETLLESVPMLKFLDSYERMNIADALIPKTFSPNEIIIKQGDSADCMYFVEDGEVKITMKQKDSDEEIDIATCRKGQYFGELALVTHKPRAASAYADGATKCAVLDVGAFERLLGPCMDILKRNIDTYEEQLAEVFGSKANISDLR